MASSREIDAFLAGVERRAYKQALFTIQDHHVALDVVQNAMLKLVERYHDKPAEELPPLFQRILQNTIHDHFRRTKVREFWVRLVSPLRDKDAENSETLESLAAASEATHQPSPEKEATSNQPCLSGCHTHPLDVVARDFAAWRRRLGKAKRAQQRAGSLGTLRFAQPTSLPV
ncbi:MAG: hypothetical protein Q8O79_02945, partial [Pseudomonadota bacterium]|nr:hypothetical protein [Pseudomonadota bacterium]